MTATSEKKDGAEDSSTTTEASAEDKEYTTCPRDWRQLRRRRGIDDRPEVSTTTAKASAEEDEPKDFNNDNIGVGRG